MNQSVDPDSGHYERNSKRASDQIVFQAMAFDLMQMKKSQASALRVLSFPGPTWLWEQALVEAFPDVKFQFTGLECDPVVWRRSAKLANILPRSFKLAERGHLVDFMRTKIGKKAKFDVIHLDWMGPWSEEMKVDLDAVISGGCSLREDGLLLISISLRPTLLETMAELEDLSYDLPMSFYDPRREGKYGSIKVKGVPQWIVQRAKDAFCVSLRPIMANIYYSHCGNGHTQPQLQLMFLREEPRKAARASR